MPIVPIVIAASLGVGALVTLILASAERPVPEHEPDLPPGAPPPPGFPKSTGYKLVDKILGLLKQAADSSKVPLGVLVGWIAAESGGKIGEITSLGERGLFQLIPDEQKRTGFTDTDRLSSDYTYSINAGLALIAIDMGVVDKLGVATKGTTYYWQLTKLVHTMGGGAVQKIVAMAQDAGEAKSWSRLEAFALANEDAIKSAVKHSPSKWFPFVDKVVRIGQPFGFGSGDSIVGEVFVDIVDPLDALDMAV